VIPPRNLSLLSNRLAKAGKRIPEAVLERDYCLAWFLVALSRTPFRERLAFKGGTAIKRCYFDDYRFSEDLDFTLAVETDFETIRRELEPVFAEARRATGAVFRFAREDTRSHQNSHTFYLGYEGPLPAPAGGREGKVDVTIRERLVFPLENRPVLRGYKEYADLPRGARIRAYSLGEIASEKVVALMDRARNEPRDLYDVWYLATGRHVDLADLGEAIEQKWEFRGKQLDEVRGEFPAKEARYRKLWGPRLSAQMVDLPEFTEVYRFVRRALRQAGLAAK
jgi:predicted nucleotidyltransferase component of viral defense system